MMKLRKWLPFVLSAALFLSCIAATGVLTVAAEATVTDIGADTNVDKVIAATDNLLASAAGSCTYFDAYGNYTTTAPTAVVHNGIIDGVGGQSERRWSVNNRDGKEVWISYDLGEAYEVSSIMVGGSPSESKGIYGFDVYISDANAGTIQANIENYTPVYSTTDTVIYGRRIDLTTPACGSKIVFCLRGVISSGTQQVWISELSAMGTAFVKDVTVTDIGTNTNVDKLIAAEDNILKDAIGTCTYFDAYGKYSTASPSAIVHNGTIDGVNGSTEGRWSINNRDGNQVWVSYDLGGTYEVSSILVGGYGSGNQGVYGFDVYVSDANAGTIQANIGNYTPVYSTTDTVIYGRRIDLKNPARGSKVVFCMTGTGSGTQQVWISELSATGTEYILPYTVTDIGTDANLDKLIAATDNILAAATGTCTYFDAYGKYSTASPSAIVHNGTIDGVNGSTEGRWSVNNRDGKEVWVSYDLGATYDVSSILLGGFGSNSQGVYGFDVYVSDANAGTIQSNIGNYTPVYSTPDTVIYGRRIDLKTPARGSKVVFCMTGTGSGNQQVWISELSATGVEYIPPYTVTDIEGTTNVDKVITPENNILVMANPTDNSVNALVFDGNVCGVNGFEHTSSATCWAPWANDKENNYLYITFDLGVEYEVDSVMFGGSGTYGLQLGCGAQNLAVYVGNTHGDDIRLGKSEATPQYETDAVVLFGRRIDFKEAKTGRYVVFRIGGYPTTADGTSRNHYQTWISELAATGTPVAGQTMPEKILCIGDSITEGLVCSNDIDGNYDTDQLVNTYPLQLQNLLNTDSDKEYMVYNAGIGGTRIMEGDDAWLSYQENYDYMRFVPEVTKIVIMLGTNDARCSIDDLKASYKTNYQKLIDALREVNPDAQIYIATSTYTKDSSTATVFDQGLIDLQAQFAASVGLPLIDVYGVTKKFVEEDNGGDLSAFVDANDMAKGLNVHPHEDGHAVTAQTVYAALTATDTSSQYVLSVKGAQLRGYESGEPAAPQALRFGSVLTCTGVTRDKNYNTIIADDATITIGGKSYPLTGMGTVVAIADRVTEGDMVIGSNVGYLKDVPAAKLYDVAADEVTFTGVVVNIPEAQFNTDLVARPYVTYMVGDEECVAYGNTMRRSVNDLVKLVTE